MEPREKVRPAEQDLHVSLSPRADSLHLSPSLAVSRGRQRNFAAVPASSPASSSNAARQSDREANGIFFHIFSSVWFPSICFAVYLSDNEMLLSRPAAKTMPRV